MNKEFFEWISQFMVNEREIESDFEYKPNGYEYYYIAWGSDVDTYLTNTIYHWSSGGILKYRQDICKFIFHKIM